MRSDTIRSLLSSAVERAVGGKDAAVSFSGGIDSGILGAMASEHGREVCLYTVGTENSHDVSKAREASRFLNTEPEFIFLTEDNIENLLKDMIRISGTTDPLTLSFEIPTFAVTRSCKESHILGGIGADELFGGYHRYIGMSRDRFGEVRGKDLERLLNFVIPHEDRVGNHFGKTLHRPYVDENLLEYMLSVPYDEILPSESRPRKALLRKVAEKMNLEPLSMTEKKAAQYGSGAMNLIRKIAKKERLTANGYISSLSGNGTDNIFIE
jgi:asparagine synthase (glutamine-hydrolysing)